jgi:alanine dehydrogenase
MKVPDTLILTRTDIAGLMGFSDYIDAVKRAFSMLASGRITGAGVLDLPATGGMFHVKGSGMPMEEDVYVAVKVNGNFPDNQKRFGLPTIQGAILLCDGIHGYPLALMDSTEITIQRTGAATAIAAGHLARTDSTKAMICGCGLQGRIQLLALKHVLPLTQVFAYDQDRERCEEFCVRVRKDSGIGVVALDNVEEGARQSDVIVTCTTSRQYFLTKGMVRPGTFIAAVGADSHDKQEIDPELLASAKVVADIMDQCMRIGDLHHAIAAGLMSRNDVHAELHEIVSGKKPGRVSREEITVFDSTGTAIQDVAAAAVAYRRARRQNIGRFVDLLGS